MSIDPSMRGKALTLSGLSDVVKEASEANI